MTTLGWSMASTNEVSNKYRSRRNSRSKNITLILRLTHAKKVKTKYRQVAGQVDRRQEGQGLVDQVSEQECLIISSLIVNRRSVLNKTWVSKISVSYNCFKNEWLRTRGNDILTMLPLNQCVDQ